MVGKSSIAALYLAAVAAAVPTKRFADSYAVFQGDGSTAAGWPSQDQWGSWDQLWNANVPLMQKSCGWNNWGADNSDAEINEIKTAIQQVAGETGVDERFVLAVVMQESKGCVRVPTTNNGVRNPGLMQSHSGSGSCDGVNPCPQSQVTQMVRDGTAGTPAGDGLQQTLGETSGHIGSTNAQAHYAAARLYNSGSVDYTNLNNGFTSTRCYANDVANRLTGWTLAPRGCTG